MIFNAPMIRLILERTRRAQELGWKCRLIRNAPSRTRVEFIHPRTGKFVNLRGGIPEVVYAEALGKLPLIETEAS